MAKKKGKNPHPKNTKMKPARFEWGGIVYRKTPEGYYQDDDGNFLRNGTGGLCKLPGMLGRKTVGNRKPRTQKQMDNMRGNQFAKGSKSIVGQYKLSIEEFIEKANEYFELTDKKRHQIKDRKTGQHVIDEVPYPYTLTGLCRHLGITEGCFRHWKKDEKGARPDFAEAATYMHQKISEQIQTGGLLGWYQGHVTWNYLKNVDNESFKDKREVETTGMPSSPVFNFITVPPGADPKALLQEGSKNAMQGEIVEGEIVEEEEGGDD